MKLVILFICFLSLVSIAFATEIPEAKINYLQGFATEDEQAQIITRFRDYLKIATVQPNPDYYPAVSFLKKEAERIGLLFETLELVPKKPIVIMKWKSNTNNPSILLNSHIDVVPAEISKWNFKPFEAFYDQNKTGNIYARGSQDMKCVSMQYLEAVDILKNKLNFQPSRDVIITFVPDEEIGGADGMKKLVETNEFASWNIAFALDEGLASGIDESAYNLYYGERVALWIRVRATGPVGHGSQFLPNTSTELLVSQFLPKVFEFRRQQELDMKLKRKKTGDQISINLTHLKSGVTPDCGETYSYNVVPSLAQAGLDVRIPPTVQSQEVFDMLESWCKPLNMTIEIVNGELENPVTSPTNPFVQQMVQVLEGDLKQKIQLGIFPASTDARFVRGKQIPVIGFSPMQFTPVLLHDHNEYLNDQVYWKGIYLYTKIIQSLASSK